MNKIIEEDILQIINDTDMSKLKNKNILITGASGMIGSYVANVLIVLNDKFNYNIGIYLLVRNENKLEKYVTDRKDTKILVQDVIDEIKIDDDMDYIFHTASPASPLIMKNKPFETNIANTVGTYQTLKLAILKKALGYVFISSREIYGQPSDNQEFFYEDGKLGDLEHLIPRNGYAEGKKAAENMCSCVMNEYGINTKIIRLAHTYGPGMSVNDGRVQADFLKNAINNEDIIMKSDGSAVRTYTYIADAVNAIFKVLLNGKDIVYNVSNDSEKISIKTLALTISSLVDRKVIMDIDNSNAMGTASFTLGILSSQKIREELGWIPRYSLKDGFLRTINYLKMNKEAK